MGRQAGNNSDELRSVRVEFGDGQSSKADAPVVEDASSTRRGPLVVGLVAVVLLVVAFLSLRPASDQAADGTNRQAPSEEPAPEVAPDDTDSEEPAPSPSSVGDLVPRRIESQDDLRQIIRGDNGFFGVGFRHSNQVLRSIDGVDWFPIEASFSPLGESSLDFVSWGEITTTQNGFQMVGQSQGSFGLWFPRVVVSETGAEWTELDLGGSSNADEDPLSASVITDNGVFGFGPVGRANFESFVLQNFDVDVPSGGICASTEQDDSSESVEIYGCDGSPIDTLDATAVVDQSLADDVLGCMTSGVLSTLDANRWTLVRQDWQEDGERTVLREVTGIDVPLVLGSGDVAVIDSGIRVSEQSGSCEGLLRWPETVEPSVVVFDSETEQIRSWPLPNGQESFPTSSRSTVRSLVGEVEIGDSSQLVANFDGDLWALSPDSGEWIELIAGELLNEEGLPIEFALSETGTRVYAIDQGALQIFDFAEGQNGSLQLEETSVPFSQTVIVPSSRFSTIHYADDDVLFLSTPSELWVVDVPEVPG